MKAPPKSRRSNREIKEHVHRSDDAHAFLPDPDDTGAHSNDSLAENLAEVYLQSATSGEEMAEDVMNELVPEELGGPFLEDGPPEEILPAPGPKPRAPRPR